MESEKFCFPKQRPNPPDGSFPAVYFSLNFFKKLLTRYDPCANIGLALRKTAHTACASGGIGRLAGFRCRCSQGRAGSTPASRTKREIRKNLSFLFSIFQTILLFIQKSVNKMLKGSDFPVISEDLSLFSLFMPIVV